jgi:hypothetical protein
VVFLLIPLSCIAHVGCGFLFGNQQQWPAAELLVISAALIALLRMFFAARPLRGWLFILNAAGWLIALGFLWWTQIYSSYPKMAARVKTGETVSGFLNKVRPDQSTNDSQSDSGNGLPAAVNDEVIIDLAALQEEEIFLDASGKSFQLLPTPITAKQSESVVISPKTNASSNYKPTPVLQQSSASLLVFFRGWW